MQRYLDTASYAVTSYKQRLYHENVLKNMGCEISHFTSLNPNIYNFSKIIIKRIISAEEWGLSPMKEKEFIIPELKTPMKYNYWDYINSFTNVFLYENAKRKHSWFIKICGEVYNRPLPNWFLNWWFKSIRLSYNSSLYNRIPGTPVIITTNAGKLR